MSGWKFRLADGRVVRFENLREQDLPEVVEALNSVIREGVYLTLNEEVVDMEKERKWYHDHMEAGMTYLVVRVDDEIVGGAGIEPRVGKESHVAVLGVSIKERFRNMGIGTRLTEALIDVARQRGFEIVELAVYNSNERAFHVYKKCGFQEVGRIKRGAKLPDGTYTEKIIMVLPLRNTSRSGAEGRN